MFEEGRDIGGEDTSKYPTLLIEGYAVGPWTPHNTEGLPPFTEVHFALIPHTDPPGMESRVVMRLKSARAVDDLIRLLWEARVQTFGPARRPI